MRIMWDEKWAIANDVETTEELALNIAAFSYKPLDEALFSSVEEALDKIEEKEEKVGAKITRVIKVDGVVYVRCEGGGRKPVTLKIYMVEVAEEM